MRRITDFTELKAYADIHNERGHKGFKEPINPFLWWNHGEPGKVDDTVHAYFENGLVVVLELECRDGKEVNNMMVFALCPQKNILDRVLDICQKYGTVVFNSEFGDRYREIVKRLDGASWQSNKRIYYSAHGGTAWVKHCARR
jgi:hypothetical protein